MPLLLNQLPALSVRVVTPWTGVWFADVDFELDETLLIPSGPAVLTLGTTVLIGTIDPRFSGSFGTSGKARVVAGGGGWDKQVSAQHFHNDAGVLSSLVRTATALEVGEKLVDAAPARLGIDYMRAAGPASNVLAGVDWYVNQVGATIVGPRIPLPASPLVDILSWNPSTQTAELATDELIVPGTVLIDTALRFDVTTVRDVEQTFDENGARATAWCGAKPKSSRILDSLSAIARSAVGLGFLKKYVYRVVAEGVDGRLTLQAVKRSAGVPDALPISIWPGMAGDSAKVVPGTEVIVEFIDGDPSNPIVRGFKDGSPPLTRKISAVLSVAIDAVMFKVGLGAEPVAKAPEVLVSLIALQTEVAAIVGAMTVVLAIPGPITPAHTSAFQPATAAVTAAIAALASAAGTLPSTNTMVD